MTKFIDIVRTVYGYTDGETEQRVTTGDMLQTILSDDAQGYKRVHNVMEVDVIGGDLEKALNKARRWARAEGYSDPIRKASVVEHQGGAFRR